MALEKHHYKPLAYIHEHAGKRSVDDFTDEFEPLAASIWRELEIAGLAFSEADDTIHLTPSGQAALAAINAGEIAQGAQFR